MLPCVRGIRRHEDQNESSCHSMELNKRRSRCCRPVDLWPEAGGREPRKHSERIGSHMTCTGGDPCDIAFGVGLPDLSILRGRVLDFDLDDRSVFCDIVLDIKFAQIGGRRSTRDHQSYAQPYVCKLTVCSSSCVEPIRRSVDQRRHGLVEAVGHSERRVQIVLTSPKFHRK
jgi:hypothetical protein